MCLFQLVLSKIVAAQAILNLLFFCIQSISLFLFSVIGKDSDAELQDLLMELTETKPSKPSVDDKIRLWQETQTVDGDSEIKKNDSHEKHLVSTENGDEDQPGTESKTRPQEPSKKTKKKKAKNKKNESADMLRNGEEGLLIEMNIYLIGRRRNRIQMQLNQRRLNQRFSFPKSCFSTVFVALRTLKMNKIKRTTENPFINSRSLVYKCHEIFVLTFFI